MPMYVEGQKDMRDRIAVMFSSWATTHPDPVVADELWQFVSSIKNIDLFHNDNERVQDVG